MYQYLIYNQKIESEFEINFARKAVFTETPDVTIKIGKVPEEIKDQINQGAYDGLKEDSMWFYVTDKAIYYITNGNQIVIEPQNDSLTEFELCSYLTGSALALLLMQKGIVPIHGSMIAHNGKVAIITGQSGSGKSTTVFELLSRGCSFLSDDVSAIEVKEDKLTSLPAFPLQKLCRDLVERNNLDLNSLTYIDEFRDKFARNINLSQYEDMPQGLDYIIELVPYQGKSVEIKEVEGLDKLNMLTTNLYRSLVYEKMGVTTNRFEKMLTIISKAKMYQVFRPQMEDSFQEVPDIIWNNLLQLC